MPTDLRRSATHLPVTLFPPVALAPLMALALLVSLAGAASGQSAEEGARALALRQRADTAFAAADWAQAAELYTELATTASDDATVWFRVGLSTLQAEGAPAAAIEAYRKAIELGYPEQPARFGIARAEARAGRSEAAIDQLERLAAAGTSRAIAQRVESGSDFDPLRGDPRFAAAYERLLPCNTPEYRQFDFWLGEWEVRNPQEQVVGHNVITAITDGCVLFEDWTSAGGHKGISINYFDPRDGTWNQIFRDNTGNIATWPDLKGTFRDGSMVLETAPGVEPRSRWTWTAIDENRVRQMAETSSDGGETWTVTWDSYYVRPSE